MSQHQQDLRRHRGRAPHEWNDSSSVGSDDDQECISWLHSQIRPSRPGRKPAGPAKERKQNWVVPQTRRHIIELAFEAPGSTVRTGMSYTAIARKFCLKYDTVASIGWRYINNGGNIRLREPGNPNGRSKLTDHHRQWILSQQTL